MVWARDFEVAQRQSGLHVCEVGCMLIFQMLRFLAMVAIRTRSDIVRAIPCNAALDTSAAV